MEREAYIARRRKRLDELKGQYNPDQVQCNTEPGRYQGMDFVEKLLAMEEDGFATILELDAPQQAPSSVIDFSEGIFEINSSIYQNADAPLDEGLRSLIADTMDFDDAPEPDGEPAPEPDNSEENIPGCRIDMAEKVAALLSGTSSPYAAVIAREGNAFSDVFAPGFGNPRGPIFSFPISGDVYTHLLSRRRTLLIHSSFCELTELSGLIPDYHLKHILSCCFTPIGPAIDGRYLFFAFDSAVITLDNVKKIIKKINNMTLLA